MMGALVVLLLPDCVFKDDDPVPPTHEESDLTLPSPPPQPEVVKDPSTTEIAAPPTTDAEQDPSATSDKDSPMSSRSPSPSPSPPPQDHAPKTPLVDQRVLKGSDTPLFFSRELIADSLGLNSYIRVDMDEAIRLSEIVFSSAACLNGSLILR